MSGELLNIIFLAKLILTEAGGDFVEKLKPKNPNLNF
jgi:hypothetical protein